MRALPIACVVACLLPLAAWAGDDDRYVRIPGGTFTTALKYEDARGPAPVAAFAMMKRPVTNAEFLAFVKSKPLWASDRAPSVFAGPGYLDHWAEPRRLASSVQRVQPVTRVSWFAANAYCEAEGARLPRWIEWEYVAAADATRRDARSDPAWRERILGWYARPSSHALPRVGAEPANAYGVQDLHGVVWEWADDYSALLVSGDNRDQGDPDRARFCGAGALSMDDRDNYAVLMRVAMLSSLQGRDVTRNMGFRCVKDAR
ncbi:MAG: formylglycine-generating enzyme family protein [Betaproteobacteria bacterium]